MPRAFLITHRRYNGTEGFEDVGRGWLSDQTLFIVYFLFIYKFISLLMNDLNL